MPKSQVESLKKEMINKAAGAFLNSSQREKNKHIDRMLDDFPPILEFIGGLDYAHPNQINKEIIIQLIAIFYLAMVFQKIKIKPFHYDDLSKSLKENHDMQRYFFAKDYQFDKSAFGRYLEQYPQKEVMNYTYFAINHQFSEEIENEQDARFIFTMVKSVADTMLQVR